MTLFNFSSAENRLIFASRRTIQRQAREQNATYAAQANVRRVQELAKAPTATQYFSANPTAQPNRGAWAGDSSGSGYNINYDPNFVGTRNADSGYTGDPYYGDYAQGAEAYANSLGIVPTDPGVSRNPEAERMALESAKQTYYAQKNAEIVARQAKQQQTQNQLNQSAGAASKVQGQADSPATTRMLPQTKDNAPSTVLRTGDINAQTKPATTMQERAGQRRLARQAFIDQKRAEGVPDAQIREELRRNPLPRASSQVNQDQPSPTATPTTTPVPPAASTTPTTPESTQPPSPITPPKVATDIGEQMYQMALANGDPMAGITKALYDDFVQQEAQQRASALASLGESLNYNQQSFNDAQTFIDKWANLATQNSDKLTKLLTSQNDETNKILEQQKFQTQQKLAFDQQVQTQQLEKQKAQDVLKSSIAMALRGGAYSGAGQEAIASAEREWDVAIQNLAKEYSFKAADVAMDYTTKYTQAKQNLALNLFNASEALNSRLEGYAGQAFNSLQAKKKADADAKNAYRSNLDTMLKEHSTFVIGLAKDVRESINQKRDDERAQTKENKDNAYQMFNFAFTNSSDPAMRKAAVDQMRAAGYNLPSNIDYANLTPDQQIRMLDLAEKQKKAMSLLNPADFEGEAKSVAMMAANVQLNLTDSDKGVFAQTHAPLIASLLHQGKAEEARRIIFDAAVTNLSQSRKDVADRRALISWVDHTIQKLEAAESLPGFYTTKWNDAKRYFGAQKDPAFRDLSSVVALASVESLHELYGSALTANELETARQILPLKDSNMGDAIQQLKNFRQWQNNKQEEIVNAISGGGAFGAGSSLPSSNTPTNEGMGNIINGGEETSMETTTINNRQISARPSVIAALTRANNAMIADGLEGIDVMSSFRNTAQQQAAYDRFQKGEIARAAKPGTSLHEKGLAFDIRNWKQAEKYLKAQGFNPLPADIRSSDPGHFSFLYIG